MPRAFDFRLYFLEMETLAPEFIDDLFRFAFLQTGDRQFSVELIIETAAETAVRASQWRTQEHRFLWAVQFLGNRLERSFGERREGKDLGTVLSEAMREPRPRVRAALALDCLGRIRQSETLHLFKVRAREIRVAQERFRERTSAGGWTEAEVRGRIKALQLNEEERALIAHAVEALPARRPGVEGKLGMAAVLLGVVVLLGWGSWEHWRGTVPAQMQQFMVRLLEAHRSAGDGGLDRFNGKAGDTRDWLFLHGMEGVQVPDAFASIPLAAGRVLDWSGGKFAQFPLVSLPGVFMVAEVDSLRLSGEYAASGRAHRGEWSGAWTVAGPYVFFLTMRAPEEALDPLLQGAFPAQTDLPALERIVRWFSGD